jgi:hypothetical protein
MAMLVAPGIENHPPPLTKLISRAFPPTASKLDTTTHVVALLVLLVPFIKVIVVPNGLVLEAGAVPEAVLGMLAIPGLNIKNSF